MTAYWSLFVARFALLLQYRTAALAGVATQLFWGFVKVMVLEAFFTHATSAQPMTLQEAVGYVWLGQAFLMVIVPWSGDREIQELIRSGAVGYDLLRPTDLYNFWFTRALALRTAPLLLRAVPLLSVAIFILPLLGFSERSLAFPPSFASLIAFIVSFIGAILLSSALTMLLTVSMMWTISGEGINTILPTFIIIFSGMIVPLPLFPEWIKPVLNALPFSGLLDRPFRLFSGNLLPNALFNVLLHQTFWIVVIIILGRVLVKRGIRKLVIQGG
ncbi:ABC-2 family transporter protein [Nostocaceae cyanobacterium CENA369]|uniref:ABC-2 family transporter protein n=1 Tax=Dendronalium phyllosphericum CENA369 TaxID=1725256 RepID=A0A8J7I7G9_9NOST|nr:ABC-2 family transporter protein [Dendronalium phyllosphericum]MBH8576235.1 ABC-2 family transporter protein [Dendronalium phyllosphericum CENA369]